MAQEWQTLLIERHLCTAVWNKKTITKKTKFNEENSHVGVRNEHGQLVIVCSKRRENEDRPSPKRYCHFSQPSRVSEASWNCVTRRYITTNPDLQKTKKEEITTILLVRSKKEDKHA